MNSRSARIRRGRLLLFLPLLLAACPGPDATYAAGNAAAAGAAQVSSTQLTLDNTRFLVNGKPVFLLGFSYYGALGAPAEFIESDLNEFQRLGFNWLRVWATWRSAGTPVSALDAEGNPRQPFFGRLRSLVKECDRRGMMVDISLAREKDKPESGLLPDSTAHRRAVETLLSSLKEHRNWYLDLANERDVRDGRYVGVAELTELRALARSLDPKRIVTASFGGHDLTAADIRAALQVAGLDFLAPHRPRAPGSPAQTKDRTLACLEIMNQAGRSVPIHYQEPFRRGYQNWEPAAEDFLADLRGAVEGGAAGWCFHNGQQRGAPGDEPRRSFDLSRRSLIEQLDSEERKFINQARSALDR